MIDNGKNIESFILTACCRAPKKEVTLMLLSNELTRESIRIFADNKDIDHVLSFFHSLFEIKKSYSVSTEQIIERLNTFDLRYKRINELVEMEGINGPDLIDKLIEEIVMIVTNLYLDEFLQSSNFNDWLRLDWKKKINNKNSFNERSLKESETSTADLPILPKLISMVSNIFLSSFSSPVTTCVDNKSEWLEQFLFEVRDLPIGFFLAAAGKFDNGFPLQYVNEYYKKLLGLENSELVGESCTKVLIDPKKLKNRKCSDKIKNLNLSQIGLLPVLQTLLCYNKKLNLNFSTVIGFKPIISNSGKYLYIMGILIKEKNELLGFKESKLVYDLLCLIPDKL